MLYNKHMQKKLLIIAGVLAAVVASLALYKYLQRQQASSLSDGEIMQKFDCYRSTDEGRPTDIYCSDPELYRQHAKQGTVVDSFTTSDAP